MKNQLHKSLFVFAIMAIVVTACAPQSAQPPNPAALPQPSTQSAAPNPTASTSNTSNNAPHVNVLDPTHLPLGDGKISSSPQRGYVFACQTQFNGRGASGAESWINSDGTWDSTKKPVVEGSVNWPQHSFNMTVNGDQRTFTTNDLPDHPTGVFPISLSDPAYQADRNPNSIKAQSITFSVPANPTVAAQPTCVGGEIGIMLSGVLIFSAFDAEGRDAPAHEVQDQCSGHPQEGGYYHYHDLSPCIKDNATGQSALPGYAFDGFGIYGPYDTNGKELTNADLDECHGITSQVEWNGKEVVMYHYVATREFPYVVGCFRGTPSVRALTVPSGGQGQQSGQQLGGQPQAGQNGQPPLAAINACASLSAGAACSFNAPNGQINGTCQIPLQLQQLICVPQGGAHGP
ncbi:MAG: YHYH protein [Chloroflexi bacterium]|nr:YHYH protein [Chloroflexota bacterium]